MWSVCKPSFWYSLAATVYIVAVAYLMMRAESIFGKMESIIGIIAFLLLFSLSALVVGGLLVGKPVMLYLDGKKKEAVSMLAANAGWLLLFIIIAMIYLALK